MTYHDASDIDFADSDTTDVTFVIVVIYRSVPCHHWRWVAFILDYLERHYHTEIIYAGEVNAGISHRKEDQKEA